LPRLLTLPALHDSPSGLGLCFYVFVIARFDPLVLRVIALAMGALALPWASGV
jgi:hypothetical protein